MPSAHAAREHRTAPIDGQCATPVESQQTMNPTGRPGSAAVRTLLGVRRASTGAGRASQLGAGGGGKAFFPRPQCGDRAAEALGQRPGWSQGQDRRRGARSPWWPCRRGGSRSWSAPSPSRWPGSAVEVVVPGHAGQACVHSAKPRWPAPVARSMLQLAVPRSSFILLGDRTQGKGQVRPEASAGGSACEPVSVRQASGIPTRSEQLMINKPIMSKASRH